MPKCKLTKHEDDIRRGLRSPDSIPPYGKLRKSAENSPPQSPHDGIHTCSKGCKKRGCNRALRDTIQEQDEQIEALKRDLLEKTAKLRKKAQERVHDINQIGGLQEENARLKAEVERLTAFTTRTIIPNEELQAEVDRLTADLQMEKENEDRLVREWQRANNEVYGLQRQVAALIDDQTRLKAEVERLKQSILDSVEMRQRLREIENGNQSK